MSPNNEEKKKGVIEFLKKNPKSTCKILKNSGYTHLERLFKKGLGEAFKEAGLNPPRTFERKTREQRRRIIINYIKKHPIAGGQDIQKDTKINIKNAFRNTKEAFKAAEITYPRRRFLALKKKNCRREKKGGYKSN